LIYDALNRQSRGEDWKSKIQILHCATVQTVVQLRIHLEVLQKALEKEWYAYRVLKVIYSNDEKMFFQIVKKLKSYDPDNTENPEFARKVGEYITEKTQKIKANAPPLVAFLPRDLPDEVRKHIERRSIA
jgi:hypothetical protein